MDLTYYLKICYTHKNIGYPQLNCWGLVCEFYRREKNITLDLFPSEDMRTLDKCYLEYRKSLKETAKKDNCITAFFKHGVCVHCGIYLRDNKILHTDRCTAVQPLQEILKIKNYDEVRFYDAA